MECDGKAHCSGKAIWLPRSGSRQCGWLHKQSRVSAHLRQSDHIQPILGKRLILIVLYYFTWSPLKMILFLCRWIKKNVSNCSLSVIFKLISSSTLVLNIITEVKHYKITFMSGMFGYLIWLWFCRHKWDLKHLYITKNIDIYTSCRFYKRWGFFVSLTLKVQFIKTNRRQQNIHVFFYTRK